MTALSFSGVTKRFGAAVAVDALSLDIAEGEFFALLGPSGCGKTTLLRLAAGFEVADAGGIAIDGADVSDLPPNRRPVNTVFQSYALFPHLSVADNVAYGLKVEGVDAPERARRDRRSGSRPARRSARPRPHVRACAALWRRPRHRPHPRDHPALVGGQGRYSRAIWGFSSASVNRTCRKFSAAKSLA